MRIIRPTPNLNGDSKETLLDQMITARRALILAAEAMQAALPHGRNYPVGDYRADRDEAVRRIAAVRDLADLYYEDALALDKED
jgi:hypothetical protein